MGTLLLVCAWAGTGAPHEAQAQEAAGPCADTLETAEKAYRNRNYRRAVTLASQCTDQQDVGEETAIRAYRVITLASLRQGALVQARSAVTNILRIDPSYTADPVNDPPSYDLFVSMVRREVDVSALAEEEAGAPEEGDAGAPEERGAGAPEEGDAGATEPEISRTQAAHSTFFVKPLGIGFSDYTGDMPAQSYSHPLDLQEFSRGSGFPFVLHSELGYQFAPKWGLVLGMQVGNYPIVGYNTGDGGISDSWRYTPQLLVRYAFGPLGESVAFYVDGGVNATFGGQGIAKTGYGPSVGGGVDIPFGNVFSFYVESRFNFTLPDDAIDGSNASDFGNVRGSSTGPFDSVNQLLGVGLRIRFGGSSSAPPQEELPTQE